MRPIPQSAIDFIKAEEAKRLTAYQDGGGVWTIGYGHTGPEVKRGYTITDAQADSDLDKDLATAQQRLAGVVNASIINELTEHQYGALISFVLNLGAKPEWTIWKRLNRREFDQVPLEMMRFVYDQDPSTGKPRKVNGLVNRRADEVKFWSVDEPGSEDIRLTSANLREADTPPIAIDPTPPRKSATIWAAITAPVLLALKWLGDVLSQVPDFAQTALNAINPFAEHSQAAQMIANGVGGLAAVAGLYVAWSVVKKKKEQRS